MLQAGVLPVCLIAAAVAAAVAAADDLWCGECHQYLLTTACLPWQCYHGIVFGARSTGAAAGPQHLIQQGMSELRGN